MLHIPRTVIAFCMASIFSHTISAVELSEQHWKQLKAALNNTPMQVYNELTDLSISFQIPGTTLHQKYWSLYCLSALTTQHNQVALDISNRVLQSIPNSYAEARSRLLNCRARAHQFSGDIKKAENDGHMALKLSETLSDESTLIITLITLGEIYLSQSKFTESQKLLRRAFTVSENHEDKNLKADINSALGKFYTYQGEKEKALPFYEHNFQHDIDTENYQKASISSYNLASVYSLVNNFEKALEYYLKSIELCKQIDDKTGVAYGHKGLAYVYLKTGEIDKSEKSLAFAKEHFANQKNLYIHANLNSISAGINVTKGNFYLAEKQYAKALEIYINKNNFREQARTLEKIVSLHEENVNFRSAFKAITHLREVEKSIAARELKNNAKRLRNELLMEVKDAKSRELQKNLEIEKEKLKQKNTIEILQSVIIFIACLLLTSLIFNIRKEKIYARKMRDLAMHDELTGIFNRRAIMSELQRVIEWSIRLNQPLAIAIIDIDHFKIFNDNHGHATGDKVLIYFSNLVAKNIRKIDSFGRYGGEEFLLIMPNTSLEHAQALLTRIREYNKLTPLMISEREFSITFSAGISPLNEINQENELLLEQADKALYNSKLSGRDKISIFDSSNVTFSKNQSLSNN